MRRGMIFVVISLWVICCRYKTKGLQIQTTPDEAHSVWISAVELRNGDRYYISNRTQQAVINHNLYVFQDFNLFYYRKKDETTTFIGNIPSHTPKSLALIPNVEDGVDEGNRLLVMTPVCLVSFDAATDPYAQKVTLEAGDCYESGIRDGLMDFARFNALGSVAAGSRGVWALSDNLIMHPASRLCLLHNNMVTSFGGQNAALPTIHTMSISVVVGAKGGDEVFIAVCWRAGGLSIVWLPRYSLGLQTLRAEHDYKILPPSAGYNLSYRYAQIVVNSITLFQKEGKRQLYLFVMMGSAVAKDVVVWQENATAFEIGSHSTLETFPDEKRQDLISLYVDFPYGVFVADGHYKEFMKVNTLGCVCPPGYALVPSPQPLCQLAPLGGYVDIMGNFIPCPPGTFGGKQRATSRQACLPCPPFTFSNTEQSVACSACIAGGSGLMPHNPAKTDCIPPGEACPEGSYMGVGGCVSCRAGYYSAAGVCAQCPPNTFSDPSMGIWACTACPAGKIADAGAASCSTLCNASSRCAPRGSCEAQRQRKDLVLTISILGARAVGAALAANGTVYVAGFQLLITIERSGTSINTPLHELTLVRDLALSRDERILFAAVTAQEILCFTFVGTPHVAWTKLLLVPQTAIVGIALVADTLLAHDVTTHKIYGVHLEDGRRDVVYSSEAEHVVVGMAPAGDALYVLVSSAEGNASSYFDDHGPQRIVRVYPDKSEPEVVLRVPRETVLHRYMAFWQGKLILSVKNSIGYLREEDSTVQTLVGSRDISGRGDNIGEAARFTAPGPMMAFGESALLVVDRTALRAVYALGEMCLCDEDFYMKDEGGAGRTCLPCPLGQISPPGSIGGCSNCNRGQYYDPTGECVPCPKMKWWADGAPSTCPLVVDTMTGRDTAGLSMQNIFQEMSEANPQHYEALNIMKAYDYVSMHTLQLPLNDDSLARDDVAQGRFWVRSKRITPPPPVSTARLTLPGFWIICGAYVLQTETCSCDLPAGGIKLGGNDDIHQLWNRERYLAERIDHSTLRMPDIAQVAPTAIFVSRTDAGGGNVDDEPSVVYVSSVLAATQVSIPPQPEPTPSESSFAACVAGWPATYRCPSGFLWVPPLHACMPCKAGFYHDDSNECLPCPVGTFSALEGATKCLECASSRSVASTFCPPSDSDIVCDKGYESHMGECLPCIPGFFKANASVGLCAPCMAGSFSDAIASTACTRCAAPLVSAQWGGTQCIACDEGYVADGTARCRPCTEGYYHAAACWNKTVHHCERGYYLQDGGAIADNQCVACRACQSGEIMVPFDPHPCDYETTTRLGAPYRCIPVESVPGLFARLALQTSDIRAFDIQYTPCEGLPGFARWAQGPDPSLCYFQCNYAISEAGARQYAYFYSAEQGAAATSVSSVLSVPVDRNLFLLDYPGLSVQLMLLSKEICLPCPKSQCGWGRYRPITDAAQGCGAPTCGSACQVVPGGVVTQYRDDGCAENCSFPANSYLSSLAPPGTGDNCGWMCRLGFFMDTDRDQNETGLVCRPCTESVCEKGEIFIPHKCLPTSDRRSFCLPCPADQSKNPAVLSMANSSRGVCAYECSPGSYDAMVAGMIPTCVPCSDRTFCQTGFRRVCSAETCVACPILPSALWASAVRMPSNKNTCQVACRTGYHTVDLASGEVVAPKTLALSYDVGAIACTLCSLRPSIPCTAMACAAGYYMPVAASGVCKPCPTVYDCGAGLAPSPACLCTICRVKTAGAVFIHQRAAEALPRGVASEVVMDYGTCPAVCENNRVLVMDPSSSTMVCRPCSALVSGVGFFGAYYSVWNASGGTRWWDRSQDPGHLPRRSEVSAEERRAGVCWPCPPGTMTAPGDADLCRRVLIADNDAGVVRLRQQLPEDSDLMLVAATNTVNSISSAVYNLFSSLSKRYSSAGAQVLIKVDNKNLTSAQASPTARRLLFSAPQPVSPKQHSRRRGIKAQPHKIVIVSEQNIQTCPSFAERRDEDTKTICVCKRGFQRHPALDLCVKRRSGARAKAVAQGSVLVIDNDLPPPEECATPSACPSGKYRDTHGNCRLCPGMLHVYDERLKRCVRAVSESCGDHYFYRDLSREEAPCTRCPEGAVALHPVNYRDAVDACVCPRGTELRSNACTPCPRGAYSAHMGLGRCTPCPRGLSTRAEGAANAMECVREGAVEDSPFVHPGANEFYLSTRKNKKSS